MGRRIDLTGQKFGRLTVISETELRAHSGAIVWQCVCECGQSHQTTSVLLRAGQTKSCGCLFREVAAAKGRKKRTHGKTDSRAYASWVGMRQRCSNERNKKYPIYGGRGIVVCDRWADFANFLADMGEPGLGMSLDRIDVNGNYELSNCRWATQREQQNNRRDNVIVDMWGVKLTMSEFCRTFNLNSDKVQQRLKRGYSMERAVAA